MPKYCPPPWRYDKDNLNVYGAGMIAQTFGHSHNGEREANARLIAAAPDLLDGAKRVLALLNEGKIVRDITHDGGSDFALRAMNVITDIKVLMNAVERAETTGVPGLQAEE